MRIRGVSRRNRHAIDKAMNGGSEQEVGDHRRIASRRSVLVGMDGCRQIEAALMMGRGCPPVGSEDPLHQTQRNLSNTKKVAKPATSRPESFGPDPSRSTDSGRRWPNAVPKSAPAARLTRSGIAREKRSGLKERATIR